METNEPDVSTGEIFFEEPYNQLLPRFKALAPSELIQVNADIPAAATRVLGVQRALLELKDRLARELPEFDQELPDKLNLYALAVVHAHSLYMMAISPADALQPMVDEGTKLHATLLADAGALVQRNLVDGQQLRDLNGTSGYKNLALDLHILAQFFRNGAAAIKGKCATQPAEIQRAEQISATIFEVIGLRERSAATVAAASDMRNRAFTVFVNVYDDVQRAVTYLRWREGDANHIAPSLYAVRSAAKKKPTPPAHVPPTREPALAAPPSNSPTNGVKTEPAAQPFLDAR